MKIAGKYLALSKAIEEGFLTKLNNYLPEIIWMSRPIEESFIADCGLILCPASEKIFLNITDSLHNKPNSKQNYPRNISPRSKRWLGILCNIRRVQDSDW